MLQTSDFYYDLPEELIAQTPLERRDGSRLMTLNKETILVFIIMSIILMFQNSMN